MARPIEEAEFTDRKDEGADDDTAREYAALADAEALGDEGDPWPFAVRTAAATVDAAAALAEASAGLERVALLEARRDDEGYAQAESSAFHLLPPLERAGVEAFAALAAWSGDEDASELPDDDTGREAEAIYH